MSADDGWAGRIASARQAALDAARAEEQAIRDAVAAGATPSDVARALGTKNRQRVYAILGRGPGGGEPARPAMTPVVYLRGAGNGEPTWERVQHAMWARGWPTVGHRTDAFHLARGGVPVVLCDFSTTLDETGGAHYGYDLYVVVGRVRARYGAEQEMELPRVNGGKSPRPYRGAALAERALDEQALARLVGQALAG